MRKSFILFFALISISLSGQSERESEITLPSKPSFDYKGEFCKPLSSALVYEKDVSVETIEEWSNYTLLKWLRYDEKDLSKSNINSHYKRLMYVAFHKCEALRNYYHLLYDSKNIGNETIENQHIRFAEKLHFLNRRGFKVLPDEYKRFDNMEIYKKNLNRFDWVLMMDSEYLGRNKYLIEYFLFSSDSNIEKTNLEDKIMEIMIEFDNDKIITFNYTEYPNIIKKATDYMIQVFGMPPPPPPSMKK